MSYEIRYASGFEKDLRRLPRRVLKQVDPIILGLAHEPRPRGATKLKGSESTYRLRIGDWRLVYEIDDHGRIILLLIVAHRSTVYRDL